MVTLDNKLSVIYSSHRNLDYNRLSYFHKDNKHDENLEKTKKASFSAFLCIYQYTVLSRLFPFKKVD